MTIKELNNQADQESTNTQQLKVLYTSPGNDEEFINQLNSQNISAHYLPLDNASSSEDTNFNFRQLKPAIDHATENNFNIVVCFDVKKSKLAIAVRKDLNGNFIILNAHQLSALLVYSYLNDSNPEVSFRKSVNITDMIAVMVLREGLSVQNDVITAQTRQADNTNSTEDALVFSMTENQEFYHTSESFSRIIERITDLAFNLGKEEETLFDTLISLYKRYGFYKEKSFAIDYVSEDHKKRLLHKMNNISKNIKVLDERLSISKITDYKKKTEHNLLTNKKVKLSGSTHNIIRLESGKNLSVSLQASEEKMNYFISIKSQMRAKEDYSEENRRLDTVAHKCIEILNKM